MGERFNEMPKLGIKEQLKNLRSVEIEDIKVDELPNLDVFAVNVKDQKLWESKEEREKIYSIFNGITFDGFENRDSGRSFDASDKDMVAEAKELVDFNVCGDKIFVIAEGR